MKKNHPQKQKYRCVSHVRVSQVAKTKPWMIWLTVNHCSPLLPRMPWIVSRIIEAGWTAVTRLAKCSKDARQREKRKRKERKPVRWHTVPRSSTNCVALRPPSPPSRAHRRVRLCSAPSAATRLPSASLDQPPKCDERLAPLPASRQLSRGMRGQKLN